MRDKWSSPYVRPPQHIFTVGQRVRYVPAQSAVLRPRQEDEALYAASFEVLRLLPRAESALYYRVRGDAG